MAGNCRPGMRFHSDFIKSALSAGSSRFQLFFGENNLIYSFSVFLGFVSLPSVHIHSGSRFLSRITASGHFTYGDVSCSLSMHMHVKHCINYDQFVPHKDLAWFPSALPPHFCAECILINRKQKARGVRCRKALSPRKNAAEKTSLVTRKLRRFP